MVSKGDMHQDVWAAFALLRRVTRPAAVMIGGLDRAEQTLVRNATLDRLITPPDPRDVLAVLLRADGSDHAAPIARRGQTTAATLPKRHSKPTLLPNPKGPSPRAKLLPQSDQGPDKPKSMGPADNQALRRAATSTSHKPMTLKQVAETRLSRRHATLKQKAVSNGIGATAQNDPNDKVIPLSQKASALDVNPPSSPKRHPLEQLAVQSNSSRAFKVPKASFADDVDLETTELSHAANGTRLDGVALDAITRTATVPDKLTKSGPQKPQAECATSKKTPAPKLPLSKSQKTQMKATPPDRVKRTSPRLDDEQQSLEDEAWRNGVFER